MDEFGLYPREEPFDPLGVMLFKALQVIAFLFFIALLAVSPESKEGKIDSKAEFIITMDWPYNHPDDLDLFVQDPVGNIVWYRHREAGFLTLDRDDRVGADDFIIVHDTEIPAPNRPPCVSGWTPKARSSTCSNGRNRCWRRSVTSVQTARIWIQKQASGCRVVNNLQS